MSKLKILGVAALLGLLVMGGAWATEETGSTTVSWNTSSSCWITLTVHSDVSLGTASGAGDVLEETGNPISISNNCTSGVTLEVEPTAVTDPYQNGNDGDLPNGASVFDDFEWKASNATNFSITTGTYTTFSGKNDKQTVGDADGNSVSSVEIDYRYTTDVNDVPGPNPGDYSVTLKYTATGS